MRPSTYTCEPLRRYSPAISASFPKNFTRCHSVFSVASAPSRPLRTVVVARRIEVTAMPPCVYLVSGSSPRLPTRITLLMPRAMECVSSNAGGARRVRDPRPGVQWYQRPAGLLADRFDGSPMPSHPERRLPLRDVRAAQPLGGRHRSVQIDALADARLDPQVQRCRQPEVVARHREHGPIGRMQAERIGR